MGRVGTARLLISNDGGVALELSVEPWAETYRMLPQQTLVVVTHSPAAAGTWTGTLRGDEPFQVEHSPEAVTVWANGHCFHVMDTEENAIGSADRDCPAQDAPSWLRAWNRARRRCRRGFR